MKLVEFLQYAGTAVGINAIVGFVLSFVVEWFPEYEELGSKWKRVAMMGLCFVIPVVSLALLVLLGEQALNAGNRLAGAERRLRRVLREPGGTDPTTERHEDAGHGRVYRPGCGTGVDEDRREPAARRHRSAVRRRGSGRDGRGRLRPAERASMACAVQNVRGDEKRAGASPAPTEPLLSPPWTGRRPKNAQAWLAQSQNARAVMTSGLGASPAPTEPLLSPRWTGGGKQGANR